MRAQKIHKLCTYTLIFCVALIAMMLIGNRRAYAADDFCTWTGAGGNANYSNSNNWSGCDNAHTPESGDTLILPDGPTNKTITFTSASMARNIMVNGDNYQINSNTIGDILIVSNMIDISGDNTNISAITYFISSSDMYLNVSGSNNQFSSYIVLQPSAGGLKFNIDVSGDVSAQNISNAGGTLIDSVVKLGEGTMTVTGGSIVNGFNSDNGLDITAGTWRCNNDRCVGNDVKPVVLEEGGTSAAAVLELNNASISLENPLYFQSTSGDSPIIRATQNATITGNISLMTTGVLEAASSRTLTASSGVNTVSGQSLQLGGNGTVVQAGVVNGGGGVTVTGNAQLTNTNSYSGTTTISGTLTISDASALGSNSVGTTINNNGQLVIIEGTGGGYTLDEDITLQGDGPSNTGAIIVSNSHASNMTLTGNLVLSGNTLITNNSVSGSAILDTVISGSGDITLTGNGGAANDFIIDGASPNTYSGTMTVNQGTVRFDKNGSVSNALTVAAHTTEDSSAVIGTSITNALSNSGAVTLTNASGHTANLIIDSTETIGGLSGNGVINTPSGTLVLNGTGSYTFTGDLTIDTLTKSGSGTQTVNDVDATTINVTGGVLVIKGTTSATTTFGSGSVLKGTGPLGNTVIAGTLAPGLSPGIMTINGNLNLTNGTYQAELNGTVAGTGYDQAVVSGTTTLSNTTLSASIGFVPAVGNSFTIVRSATISGTFNGLADGSTFTVSGINVRINYNLSASGEDTVVLTVVSLSTAPNTGLGQQSILPTLFMLQAGIVLAVLSLKRLK